MSHETQPAHALDPAPGPPEPLPARTRVLTLWQGHRFTEIDAATGEVIAEGRIDTHATQDDGA